LLNYKKEIKMKFVLNLKEVQKTINLLARVASSKTSLPILSNILITKTDKGVRFSATDLETAIQVDFNLDVSSSASLAVPARIFSELVSNLQQVNDVKFEIKNNKLFITTSNNETYINGVDSTDFPELPQTEEDKLIKLNAVELKDALGKTVFVASRDETRPVLNGCLFKFNNQKLNIVATDGYRLARKIIQTDSNLNLDIIIPASAIQELIKTISAFEDVEDIDLSFNDNSIKFNIGSAEIISKTIDGKYPDYEQIIPSEFSVKNKLNKNDFSNNIKLASLFAKESAGSITISKTIDDDFINIKSDSNQVGENNSKVKVVESTGEGSTTLNGRYVSDAIGAIDVNELAFNYSEGVLPCMINPIGDDSYIHIIMPLKA
jgi:DNA polymerase-3 subunit beta